MSTDALFFSLRRAVRWALGAVAAAAFLASGWIAPARADIIVVNGRLAAHASVSKTVAGPGVAPAAAPDEPAGTPAATPASPGESGCETAACRPTPESDDGEGGQDGQLRGAGHGAGFNLLD